MARIRNDADQARLLMSLLDPGGNGPGDTDEGGVTARGPVSPLNERDSGIRSSKQINRFTKPVTEQNGHNIKDGREQLQREQMFGDDYSDVPDIENPEYENSGARLPGFDPDNYDTNGKLRQSPQGSLSDDLLRLLKARQTRQG